MKIRRLRVNSELETCLGCGGYLDDMDEYFCNECLSELPRHVQIKEIKAHLNWKDINLYGWERYNGQDY